MPEDDSAISEITILPDGRLCLFGASREVLETLAAISLEDPALKCRMDRLRTAEADRVHEPSGASLARHEHPVNHRVEQ